MSLDLFPHTEAYNELYHRSSYYNMHMVLSAKILYYDSIRLDSSMPYRSLAPNPASAFNAFCCIAF